MSIDSRIATALFDAELSGFLPTRIFVHPMSSRAVAASQSAVLTKGRGCGIAFLYGGAYVTVEASRDVPQGRARVVAVMLTGQRDVRVFES